MPFLPTASSGASWHDFVKKLVRKQGGQVEVTHYIDAVFEHPRWGGQSQAGENNHVHVMDELQRIAFVRLGAAHPDDRGPAMQLQLADHLGSSNVVVDSGGALVNREEFTSYGETSFGSFARKRYRFTGKERDEESGLNYHGARYYGPWKGRWVSVDLEQSRFPDWSPFCYSLANPVGYVDPNGTDPEADTITVHHRTTDRQAKGMAKAGSKNIASQPHVWLGEGFYTSSSPNIPGSTARGDTIIAVKIRTDNLVDVTKALGPIYEESTKGSQLRGSTSYSGTTKDDYPFKAEGSHKQKMAEVLRKYPGKTLVIRMPDGTTHYVIRSTSSFAGKPTIVGTINQKGEFVSRSGLRRAPFGTDTRRWGGPRISCRVPMAPSGQRSCPSTQPSPGDRPLVRPAWVGGAE
jgi:RHS repeat-associated protein